MCADQIASLRLIWLVTDVLLVFAVLLPIAAVTIRDRTRPLAKQGARVDPAPALAEAPTAAEDDAAPAPETPRRPTHTMCLRAILDAGETPVWREKAIGIVEVGDADYHHFVLEILARDGGFTSLFEIDIADPHAVAEAHPFIVLRLSVKTDPRPKL